MNYKIIAWVTAASMVFLIVCYVVEIDFIGNTIQYNRLLRNSLIIALIIGIFLGYRLHKWGNEQVDKIRIWAACLLFPLFFAPWLGSLTNRFVPWRDFTTKSFEFIEEVPFAASAYGFLKGEAVEKNGCYLFVYYEGEIHRLKRKTCEHSNEESGNSIPLEIKKGLWGYEIVKR